MAVHIKIEFWALVLSSLVLPAGLYAAMALKKSISRVTVVAFGSLLILMSTFDALMLQQLVRAARSTPSVLDDQIFLSESSIALYLLPLVSAAIGTNIVSHVLIQHLARAERTFDRERLDGD